MKRRSWRRLAAWCLSLVMLLGVFPTAALASLLDNTPEMNEEILTRLEEVVGSEDEAARYYNILQQYNLLDEDGNEIESWDIYFNGEEVTLDELRAVLEEPGCDLEQYIIVDGNIITLGDLKTMLQIEDYISYLREKYFTDQRWNAEQLENVKDLVRQINTDGIQIASAPTADVTWPTVSHAARVSISDPKISGTTATFTATLTDALANQAVSFSYAALSGSQKASGSGTVSFEGGETSKTFSIDLPKASTEGDDPVRSTAELVYYLKLDNIKNALFSGDKDAETLRCTTAATVSVMPKEKSFTIHELTPDKALSDEDQAEVENGVNWGILNKFTGSDNIESTKGKPSVTTNNYWISKTTVSVNLRRMRWTFRLKDGVELYYSSNYSVTSPTFGETIHFLGEPYSQLSLDLAPGDVSDRISYTVVHDMQSLLRTWKTDFGPGYYEWYETKDPVEQTDFIPTVKIALLDTKTPSVTGISAPAGTYYPGQVIPVTVTFSEPVSTGAKLRFNGAGQDYAAAESGGYSNVLTFPYTVQEADSTTLSVTYISGVTDGSQNSLPAYIPGATGSGQLLEGVEMSTPVQLHAITSITAQVEKGDGQDTAAINVAVMNDNRVNNWLNNDVKPGPGGSMQTETLQVMVDGDKENLYPLAPIDQAAGLAGGLTAVVPLPLNTATRDIPHVVELVIDSGDGEPELLFGKYVIATQKAARYVTADDMILTLTAKKPDGTPYADGEVIYAQDGPTLQASYTLKDKGEYLFEDADQFEWSSNHPEIANIDPTTGVITPTGSGTGVVSFTLTALNGGVEGRKATKLLGQSLNFDVGLTPFLIIPRDELKTVGGQKATVFWSSNLCDKSGETPVEFAVNVTRGKDARASYTTTVSGTASAPAASVTIPGSALAYDYAAPERNTITVTVSAVYEGKGYSAQTTIVLESKPAVVAFDALETYYITDETTALNIGWTVQNFDRFSGDDKLFEVLVTRGTEDLPAINDPGTEQGTGTGVYAGSYTLNIRDVQASPSDPTSYREVYTVTIQAKNGTDSTWSRDSFMLYVYDTEALKIMVDGEAKNSVTMSNVESISKMDQTQLLALNRDIYLKSIISANYGEYAWNEIADQFAWSSSDNSVATVNYQQGTLYENVENFTYEAYRPTTELGLSGLSDGTARVEAVHRLTGMTEALDVTVETLKDKLYLFQVYPQTTTKLTYTNGDGVEKTVTTDETGAAAIYEPKGIQSNVYCRADVSKSEVYLGTFYQEELKSGEEDWTKLERYPLNTLTMRRAAYAYLYVKDPEGKPYAGEVVNFRGGVYLQRANEAELTYKKEAYFCLNGSDGGAVESKGYEDQNVTLDADGKLTVVMDQTQWGLGDAELTAKDKVRYIFEIAAKGTEYYPLFVDVDAGVNYDSFVSSGEAVVSFRKNKNLDNETDKNTVAHPFVAVQTLRYKGYGMPANVLEETGKIGPNDSFEEAQLTTTVLWWGEEDMEGLTPTLQLSTDGGKQVGSQSDAYRIEQDVYPFATHKTTRYTVKLNSDTLKGVVDLKKSAGLYLDYYKDGSSLSRHEALPFQLTNMVGAGSVMNDKTIDDLLGEMGKYTGTDAGGAKSMDIGDVFVSIALDLAASDSYSTGKDSLFNIQLSPTSDPTKFLGFISVNAGNMPEKELAMGSQFGTYQNSNWMPGLSEILVLTGVKDVDEYLEGSDHSILFGVSGYMESLIYFDENDGKWRIQILNGGFNAGGGLEWNWDFALMAGPIPFTVTITVGGTAEVGMDALSVAYYNKTKNTSGLGNDFLTELRLYLYIRVFAGVGIDYAVIACKLGVYGQIQLDMRFQWLNRPYMDDNHQTITNKVDGHSNKDENGHYTPYNLNGQHFRLDGQVGVEFIARILFASYEKVLWSYGFKLMDESTGDWNTIQEIWKANQAAQQDAINSLLGGGASKTSQIKTLSKLLNTGAVSVDGIGPQQMLSLNLAPTLESREYLEDGGRRWGKGGISLMALDPVSALANLESNTYPYANPVVSDDGSLVVYLSDMGSTDVDDTRVAFATRDAQGTSYNKGGAIDDNGYGDSQVSLSGTKDLAVAAWTRHMASVNKDAGATLTDDDQIILMDGTEVYAGIYQNGKWTATRLTENPTADLAPVVATNGQRAIVAWRAVATGSATDGQGNSYNAITDFNEKDTILYSIFNGQTWSEPETLYNGTSGAVKGIVAAMEEGGAAAVAYTLDQDGDDVNGTTINDRDVYYAVIDTQSGQVKRSVRATRDNYLDENPQLTVVRFPNADGGGEQHFVLGWYAEHPADADVSGGAASAEQSGDTISDIRLVEFNKDGVTEQLLPDSISQVAANYSVSITPTFRFTKNAKTIDELSILWVERAQGTAESLEDKEAGSGAGLPDGQQEASTTVERDVLKGVKFYTYDQGDQISFTGAVNVAEMDEGTLIDHFDAYVSDPANNEIKAVILGSTYGKNGATEKKAGETLDGSVVEYVVPKRTTSMYTATETYADKIRVPAALADYENVKKGARTHILFTVENAGIHTINALSFDVGGTVTPYDKDINLLPGKSIQLYANYDVPLNGVVDPSYTVTASFDETEGANGKARISQSAGGSIRLDRPDLEITEAKIVEEELGQRVIQIKLNNAFDADLAKSGRSVRLSFYTDAACETPFQTDSGDAEEVLGSITIDTMSDLAMMDEGGYSVQTTFNVQDYLKKIAKTEGAGEDDPVEIPDEGIKVFIKAEVFQGEELLEEPITSNNYSNVTVENLYVRTGRDVSVTSDVEFKEAEKQIRVTVNLQNNHLTRSSEGQVVVRLWDKKGNMVVEAESRAFQDQTGKPGVINLSGEGKGTGWFTITFDGKDRVPDDLNPSDIATVDVFYTDNIFSEKNEALKSLTIKGEGANGETVNIDLRDFEADPATYQLNSDVKVYHLDRDVKIDDLESLSVAALAQSIRAKITASGGENMFSGTGSLNKSLTMRPGEKGSVTITALSGNGKRSAVYTLDIQNNGAPDITLERDAGTGYCDSVVYGEEEAKVQLTAEARPAGGYGLSYQWYACDENGENREKISGDVLAGRDTSPTLTLNKSLSAGIHYYICEVTRDMVKEDDVTYDSPVAAVEVVKATGNTVTVQGLDVDAYDGLSHTFPAATAGKSGSTVLYSIDEGKTWSETPPAFDEVGVHTVWVKATNPNYEDSPIETAAVTIPMPAGAEFKLETESLEDAFYNYPTQIRIQYQNAAAMEAALKTEIASLGVRESNTQVYDVKLLFRPDSASDWVEATEENFPSGGITVTLPYPEGVSRGGYNFYLQHLITNPLDTGKIVGEVETLSTVKTDEGIRFTTDCLSPFVLGWRAISSSSLLPTGPHGKNEEKCDGGESCPSHGFADVDTGAWYHEAVDFAISTGLMNGNGAGAFQSTAVLTRAMLAQIFYNQAGRPEVSGSADFVDTPSGAWYESAVAWAVAEGLMKGYGNGSFGPDDAITREQAAAVLYRAAKAGEGTGDLSAFVDAGEVSDWAKDAMVWAVGEGIVNGKDGARLDPLGVATRAEIAAIFQRLAAKEG